VWAVVQILQNVGNGGKLKIKKVFFVFNFQAIFFLLLHIVNKWTSKHYHVLCMSCCMPIITTLIMLVSLVICLILQFRLQIKKEFYIFWVDAWYGVDKFKETRNTYSIKK
jgi:hypothetical protein